VWVLEKVATPLSIPTGWKDDGHTLTAPNGHRVVLGFRTHVLSQAWHPDNQPLEEEHSSTQLFDGFRLTYNPKDGVREQYLGSAVVDLDNSLNAAYKKEVQQTADYQALMNKYGPLEKVNEELNAELDKAEAQIKSLSSSPAVAPQPDTSAIHSKLQSAFNEILASL
jgi:cell division septum initiation protein DivIVA